jgi:hypothetical protein
MESVSSGRTDLASVPDERYVDRGRRSLASSAGAAVAGAVAGLKRETVTLLAALVGAAALCGAFAMVRHWLL